MYVYVPVDRYTEMLKSILFIFVPIVSCQLKIQTYVDTLMFQGCIKGILSRMVDFLHEGSQCQNRITVVAAKAGLGRKRALRNVLGR